MVSLSSFWILVRHVLRSVRRWRCSSYPDLTSTRWAISRYVYLKKFKFILIKAFIKISREPLNSRTQVRELTSNDVNKDHEIIGVEVMDAVIRGEDIKDEFVNGV